MNIGQAAQESGVNAKMIRYDEGINVIAQVGRTDAGCRQYAGEDVQTLRFIKRAHDLDFSLQRIKTLLGL